MPTPIVTAPTPVYNNGIGETARTFAVPTRLRAPGAIPTPAPTPARPVDPGAIPPIPSTPTPFGDARPVPTPTTPAPSWSPGAPDATPKSPTDASHDNILEILAALIPSLTSAFATPNSGTSGGFTGTGAVPVDMPDVPLAANDAAPPATAGPSPLLWLGLVVAIVGAYFGYKAYKKARAA